VSCVLFAKLGNGQSRAEKLSEKGTTAWGLCLCKGRNYPPNPSERTAKAWSLIAPYCQRRATGAARAALGDALPSGWRWAGRRHLGRALWRASGCRRRRRAGEADAKPSQGRTRPLLVETPGWGLPVHGHPADGIDRDGDPSGCLLRRHQLRCRTQVWRDTGYQGRAKPGGKTLGLDHAHRLSTWPPEHCGTGLYRPWS